MPSFENAMFFKRVEFIGPKRKDGVKKVWHHMEFSKENEWIQACPSGLVNEALRFPKIFKVHDLMPSSDEDELKARIKKLENEIKALKARNGKEK